MWLSKRIMQQQEISDAATLGTVSMGGSSVAVVTDGEKRQARVTAPGGYAWQPKKAQGALVLRSNEDYVAGVPVDGEGLAPGEVKIFSDGAEITLRNNGAVQIRGAVSVVGTLTVNGREVVPK